MSNKRPTIETVLTVLLGVPDTDDRGLVGTVKNIEKHLIRLNGHQGKQDERIAKNTEGIKNLKWIIGGTFFGSGGAVLLALYLLGML